MAAAKPCPPITLRRGGPQWCAGHAQPSPWRSSRRWPPSASRAAARTTATRARRPRRPRRRRPRAAATTATTATTPAAPTTASVKVNADPSGQLAFVQKSLTAPAGADVFVLTNDSSVPHNLEIEGNGVEAGPSATVSGGEKAELKVTLKPGTYQFFCAIPGHREAGMEGTLTVQ